MWRFKPSKFKNATPKVPKKEGWFLDLSVGTQHSHGNHIEASAAFMAFNIESGVGGSIGILSLEDVGRKSKNLPVLHAHSDLVTDFDFCPYDDGILASGSQDRHVKIWRIPEEGVVSNLPCNPEVDLVLDNRVEVVCFHPVADCILTTSDDKCIQLWDISTKQQIFYTSHEDLIQSFSWKSDGQLLASCGRDKKLKILDPRDSAKAQITSSHLNNRDSRVIWLGGSDQVLTTGFGSGREREVLLRDVRNFGEPLATYSGDSALGVLIPLFDPDTNMLFLVGKADTAVSYWEIVDKMPFFSEATRYFGDVQIRGACLVPKRALRVMEGEVNRILLLGHDCIVPITYQVPRKTYRDFHPDLFPDTSAAEPALTVPQWQSQETCKINKISLDPSKNSQKTLLKFNHKLGSGPSKVYNIDLQDNNNPSQAINQKKQIESAPSVLVDSNSKEEIHNSTKLMRKEERSINQSKPATAQKPILSPKPQASQINENLNGFREPSPVLKVKNLTPPSSLSSTSPSSPEDKLNSQECHIEQPRLSPSPRRPTRTFGIRVSKFRHLNGTVLPKETHISDISTLTRTIPGESDGFCANSEHIAVPLGIAGGLIAVLKLSSTGRAPSLADVPGVVCGTSVMDFSWDPFDLYRLVTVVDTGEIQVWNINPGGISEKVTEPSFTLKGHIEKTNIVKFHPLARDVICTASSDLSIRIWDLAVMEEKYCLLGHTDQIFSVAWNPNGQYLATICKDQKIRLYDPRNSCLPIREGPGPQGSRGARILWVLGGAYLVLSGFSKVSERQIYLYDVKDLSTPIGTAGIDVSPAILIPHYDEDSSTLFLTGKGDSTIFAYEVATDTPYFHPLSHYKCSGPHQALSFLPKYICNIEDVEFARAIRLTTSTIEPISFTVPRLRAEFFQDDLFPDTRIMWEPTCNSEEWFTGLDQPSKFISLRPDGMTPVSQAPTPTKTPSNNQNATNAPSEIVFEGEIVLEGSLAFLQNSKEKEEMIVQSMMSQCQLQTSSLPQDSFEGVDPKEWDEEEDSH